MQRRTPFTQARSIDTRGARPSRRRRIPPPYLIALMRASLAPEARPCVHAREPMALPPGWLDGPGRSREAAPTRGVRIIDIA